MTEIGDFLEGKTIAEKEEFEPFNKELLKLVTIDFIA